MTETFFVLTCTLYPVHRFFLLLYVPLPNNLMHNFYDFQIQALYSDFGRDLNRFQQTFLFIITLALRACNECNTKKTVITKAIFVYLNFLVITQINLKITIILSHQENLPSVLCPCMFLSSAKKNTLVFRKSGLLESLIHPHLPCACINV